MSRWHRLAVSEMYCQRPDLATNFLSKGPTVNIHELAALTGETPRQVRYLVAEGLMPPPEGGRARASYGEPHVAAIRAYQRLRAFGFKPGAIRLLWEGRGGPVTLPIAPGIALNLDPALLSGGGDPRPNLRLVAERVAELLTDLLKEAHPHGPEADPHPSPADGR